MPSTEEVTGLFVSSFIVMMKQIKTTAGSQEGTKGEGSVVQAGQRGFLFDFLIQVTDLSFACQGTHFEDGCLQ